MFTAMLNRPNILGHLKGGRVRVSTRDTGIIRIKIGLYNYILSKHSDLFYAFAIKTAIKPYIRNHSCFCFFSVILFLWLILNTSVSGLLSSCSQFVPESPPLHHIPDISSIKAKHGEPTVQQFILEYLTNLGRVKLIQNKIQLYCFKLSF